MSVLVVIGAGANAAGIQVASVEGASSYNTIGTVQVFGSMAGPACASRDSSQTCNSCAMQPVCMTAPLCSCSLSRVSENGILRINLNKPDKVIGNALIATTTGMMFETVTPQNGGTFADVRWTDICSVMGSNNGCSNLSPTNHTVTIRVAVDENANGVIDAFESTVDLVVNVLNPGTNMYDVYGQPVLQGLSNFHPVGAPYGQVALHNFMGAPNFPMLGYGAAAEKVRVFISDRNMLYANALQAVYMADLNIQRDPNGLYVITPSVLSGLQPNRLYFFRIALVDGAGSVVQYFPPDVGLPPACTMGSPACPFSAIPY
jgi:hypothetical protein